ncbi:thiamine biosynthesis protein ThiJ|nr:thiamine biosynthesis protein ThiJ [Candidatus Pantoea persica]
MTTPITISLLLFPDVTQLDLTGPLKFSPARLTSPAIWSGRMCSRCDPTAA